MAFRMKPPPNKPTRKKIGRLFEPTEGMTMADIEAAGVPARAVIEWDEWGYDGGKNVYFAWKEDESEAKFQQRMDRYRASLRRYRQWEQDNQEQIKAYEESKAAKAEAARHKKIERLKKQIAQNERRLEELEELQ